MSNEEILNQFIPNEEYPSYYNESDIEQAMDLARKDERKIFLKEFNEATEGGNWVNKAFDFINRQSAKLKQ